LVAKGDENNADNVAEERAAKEEAEEKTKQVAREKVAKEAEVLAEEEAKRARVVKSSASQVAVDPMQEMTLRSALVVHEKYVWLDLRQPRIAYGASA
jgi:hypothetical protein